MECPVCECEADDLTTHLGSHPKLDLVCFIESLARFLASTSHAQG
jgi:hypothetical protein